MSEREELLEAACDSLVVFLRKSVPSLAETVAHMGLTLHQFRALVILYAEDACTTTDLAEAVGVHPSVATGIVQRMVQRGIFDRHEDPDDRRIRRLSLTPAGRELAAEVVGTARVQRRSQLEALDDAQLAQIRGALDTMTAGLVPARAAV
ncbi:MarR family winged helix-turn-helix transcriptional regulator [Demequina mangrovi]|uniref:DNA-binding transcriptional regulator, MarR family n=1 Tax=Demequina mangrovi TaxID=1043493 RepID=A0A1H6Y7M9_9MICO|nr:MarR family transcriptional regulator [Demequina mangrovi]SEJ33130.1 DNA-binding transcriptional regulator, MarR family [Demequina mangrovi]